MKYFVVNGVPQSGKDTFVDMCINKIGPYAMKISTVDFIKEIAAQCGWNGVKNAKNRKFLSDLKDLLTEWDNIPFKKTYEEIRRHEFFLSQYDLEEKGVVFIFSREPEDIKKYKETLNAEVIIVRRDCVENQKQSNHADSEVFNFKYDNTIWNNGTLDDLREQVKRFLDFYGIL